ncbi:MAG TPA: putative sulfate exporter family transporter [Sandaracinaceae bacterium]
MSGSRAARLLSAWPALTIALVAVLATPHTPFRVLGSLTTALVVGFAVRGARDLAGARPLADEGLAWLATGVLRAAVVVSALRLDWGAITAAGARPWVVAFVVVVGGLAAFAVISRALGVRGPLPALLAIGTSVCGAAAIAALAVRVKAPDDDVSRSIAVVSVLGAALSLGFVLVRTWAGFGAHEYALLAGGALHEVAHVVAASSVVPESSNLALLTKLARVAMLPMAMALVGIVSRSSAGGDGRGARVPGLAVAFFAVSIAGSLPPAFFPEEALDGWRALRDALLEGANVALASSMAAIGLRLAPSELWRMNRRALVLALLLSGAVLALAEAAVLVTQSRVATVEPPPASHPCEVGDTCTIAVEAFATS